MDMKLLTQVIAIALSISVIAASTATTSFAVMNEAEVREAIKQVLKVRHPVDGQDWWLSLGPSAPQAILSLYEEDRNVYHQIRLLGALAWFPDHLQAVALLKREAKNAPNPSVQEAAIRALGQSQGLKEQSFISNLTEHTSPRIRIAAGEALSDINHPEAADEVEKFLSQEKEEWVVRKIRTYQSSRNISKTSQERTQSKSQPGKKIKKRISKLKLTQ